MHNLTANMQLPYGIVYILAVLYTLIQLLEHSYTASLTTES